MSLYPPVSSTESFIVDVQEFINRINELIMLFFMYLLSVTFLTFFFTFPTKHVECELCAKFYLH